jgi:mono/diheme cytochrome c family protein
MKALKVVGIILLVLIAAVVGGGTYIKTALPNTGPALDIKIERSAQRIQRGEYLANHVSACMDCHSTRNYQLYAGPIAPGNFGGGGEKFDQQMGFPGAFYAPNITPYALGSWSDGEVFRAITTGVGKEGEALFPLMPWGHVGQMDKEDVYSIIAYMRSLPAVKKDNPVSKADFPVNFIINTLPHKAHFTTIPNESDTLKYGAYLVNAAACVDCHSQTDHGSIIIGTEFSGGMEFKQPSGIARSANITPDKTTGIGNWDKAMFVARFKAFENISSSSLKVPVGAVNTPMPWYVYSGMKTSDLEAIYAYLRSIHPIKHEVNRFEKI